MTSAPALRLCPICGKPAQPRVKPFCSPRCADVDLNRWLAGAYVVPGREDEDADDAPPAPGEPRRSDG